MKRILSRPSFWLAVYLAITFLVAIRVGGLDYMRVADTTSYLNAAKASTLEETLSYYRTIGYPLFLRAVIGTGRWLEPVPAIQMAMFFLSLPLFWHAVRRVSGSGWLAFAAVVPLPWAGIMRLAPRIQPDFLSSVAALVAIACLLVLVKGASRVGWWIGLGAAVFCAYQMRPATVFLVVLIPCLGLVQRWLADRGALLRLLPWATGIALTTVTPFLLFCGLRWITVGHFGLVSFGGMNLAGMAANFLDGRLVASLPEEHRRLAKSMLRLRRKRGYQPMRPDSDPVEHFRQYSENIWRVARPAAAAEYRRIQRDAGQRQQHERGRPRPPTVVQNEILSQTSRAIVRLRPSLYFRWVSSAIVYGLRQLAGYGWLLGPLLGLLVSLPLLVLRQRGRARAPSGSRSEIEVTLIGLLLLGVSYFATYLLLVCLVSFPFQRYLVSMTLFLPSALFVQLFEVWRRILAADQRPRVE